MDVPPENIAIGVGDSFTLTAEGDTADDISWIYNTDTITSTACVSTDATFTGTQSADQTDCMLSATAADITSGPYTAELFTDHSQFVAVVVVIGQYTT